MPLVTIAPAKREGMKLLISLFGMSETGKTLSALRLAAGIEPDPAKRGLLDTEGGERGRAYVDHIAGGYMYGALTAPFTPERYSEALADFIEAGVTTLVVDSASHAWFAEGGVLDMVEAAIEKNDMAKWSKPKRRLGKLTRKWLGCGLHIILCARGKQPYIEIVMDNGKKGYVLGPVVPVQEKSLRFDMTVMALMTGDGRFSVAKEDGGKCPGALKPIFASEPVMSEAMGRKLIDWIGGHDGVSAEQRLLILRGADIAELGEVEYRKWYLALSNAQRLLLQPVHDNYKSAAMAADRERAKEEAAAADGDAAVDVGADSNAATSDVPFDMENPWGKQSDAGDQRTVVERAGAEVQ